MNSTKTEFKLAEKNEIAETVFVLSFETTDEQKYSYQAGQYVNVYLPNHSGHAKSYTISSSPNEKLVALTVKRTGAFSTMLTDLPVGSTILFEGPCGDFFPEDTSKDWVYLVGGIGITPFMSVIKHRMRLFPKPTNNVQLLYSSKTRAKAAYLNEVEQLKRDGEIDQVTLFYTQESGQNAPTAEYCRMDEGLLEKHVGYAKGACYYVCGSIGFVSDIWKILRKRVDDDNIFTESFY